MTIEEAKKIIGLCSDRITDNDKDYINVDYVLSILDMIDRYNHPIDMTDYPKLNNVWYGHGPTDIYGNPVPYCYTTSTEVS